MVEIGESNLRNLPLYDQERMQKAVKVLERRRYNISPESMRMYREIIEVFYEFRKLHPELCGLSLWGSRIKGLENRESDTDVLFFTDGTPDNLEEVLAKATELMQEKVDSFIQTKRNRGHFKLDIREENLDRKFESLINKIDTMAEERGVEVAELQNDAVRREGEDDKSYFGRMRDSLVLPLNPLFDPIIGTPDVYRTREYVLQQFEDLPDGNDYFRVFMQGKAVSERELSQVRAMEHGIPVVIPPYPQYPKTVETGRKFYRTADHLPEGIAQKPEV